MELIFLKEMGVAPRKVAKFRFFFETLFGTNGSKIGKLGDQLLVPV